MSALSAAPARQSGSILVWVMVAMILLGGIIASGLMLAQTTSEEVGLDLAFRGQAMNVAQAGLVDAHSWFRRQLTQPVLAFDPKLDLAAVPPLNDTDDAATGIVREFEIGQTSLVWGRYEVRRGEVSDVSVERVTNQPGTVTPNGSTWRIRSRGFVYVRNNAAVPYNVLPNRVIASVTMESEISRMKIQTPGEAALFLHKGGSCTVATRGRVQGNNQFAILYRSTGGVPVTAGGEVTGTPSGMLSVVDPGTWFYSEKDVFGLDQAQLKSVADDKFLYPGAAVPMASWPANVPTYHLVYVEGNLVFDATRRLNGTGIIYVKGNVTINASSNSFFTGFLYVNGNLTVRAPSLLKGTVFVTGTTAGTGVVDIRGVGDYSELEYDKNIKEDLLAAMGQYRFSKPPCIVP